MDEHIDHRQRMKERFALHGLDSFSDHQVLELLLFYSIPRIDTNDTAHRLINRFGSLRGVLNATAEELTEVEGIGKNSATLIRLSAMLARRYLLSESEDIRRYDTLEKVGEYVVNLFVGQPEEQVYILMFNGKMEMISCEKLIDGSINSASFSPRAVIEKAIINKAAGVVLTHNHPTGLAVPSGNDIELTSQLDYICEQVGVNLLEHIIVAGNRYTPVMRMKKYPDNNENVFRKY